MSQGKFLAKALYDNVAETPDELPFRRGDVLTVLAQDPGGLEGWWLCSLRGQSGIAPGNRLKIVSGMGDSSRGSNSSLNRVSNGSSPNAVMDIYDQPNAGLQDYDVPPANRGSIFNGRRRSSQSTSHQRGSGGPPTSSGNSYYDTPPSSNRASGENDDGIYDTPPSSKRASSERTPPTSNRSSASRDSNPGAFLSPAGQPPLNQNQHLGSSLLNLPSGDARRRSGSRASDNCYDTPPGSNRSSLERILTEEGPPIYETLSPASSLERVSQQEDNTYDTPPVRNHALSHTSLTSQSSLRSAASNESLLSTTSGVSSSRLSHTASLPDSARSSMDIPSDTYDVPSPSNDLDRSRKQLSMDSGLGCYDMPTKSHPSSSSSSSNVPSSHQQPSDTNRASKSSAQNLRSPAVAGNMEFKRSYSLENALDDLYDTPKNNTPRKKMPGSTGFGSTFALNDSSSSVYDIPPQVTRDSVISNRSDSSDENQRLSASSIDLDQQLNDSAMWDELLLDLDSALELLLKRQQEVSKATARLSAFVNNNWRLKGSLEKTLYDIKVACSLVRNCLGEFVDFSLSSVANACKIPDKQLAGRLLKRVSPLQNTYDMVNKSFTNLEDMKWQVSLLCEPLDKNRPDDLGQIALVARDMMMDVKKVASFIQGNGTLLFKKVTANDIKRSSVAAKPPIVPKAGDWNTGKGNTGYGYAKLKNVQQRPLPAVPGSASSTPSKSDATSAPGSLTGGPSHLKRSIYDIKAELHKDDYAECDDIFERKELSDQERNAIMQQCAQEYDYVQLDEDNDDTLTRSHTKNKCQPGSTEEKKIVDSDDDKTDCSFNTNKEESYSKIDELKNEMAELDIDEKAAVDKLMQDVIGVGTVDDIYGGVDMIPVKESTLQRKKSAALKAGETSDVIDKGDESIPNDSTKVRNQQEKVDATAGDSPSSPNSLSEQELKTPVNISSDDSNFIMPDNGAMPVTAAPAEGGGKDEEDDEEDDGELDPNDRQVLVFYSEQMISHTTLLANAIDAFISVVRDKQPPNVFISHSKFVIVSAHKLVHIGDSVHRNLVSNTISERVIHSANHLCDCLKSSVNATKTAALQFPSPVAIQDMLDKVIAVSHAAHQLKVIVTQANRP